MAQNKERVDDSMFISGSFAFPPSQHENLPVEPEKIEAQNIKEIKETVKSASKFGYLRWSIYITTAVAGLVVLGRHLDRGKLEALHLKCWLSYESEKMKRYFGPVKSFIECGSHKGSEIYRLLHQEVKSCITHQEREIEIERAPEN